MRRIPEQESLVIVEFVNSNPLIISYFENKLKKLVEFVISLISNFLNPCSISISFI